MRSGTAVRVPKRSVAARRKVGAAGRRCQGDPCCRSTLFYGPVGAETRTSVRRERQVEPAPPTALTATPNLTCFVEDGAIEGAFVEHRRWRRTGIPWVNMYARSIVHGPRASTAARCGHGRFDHRPLTPRVRAHLSPDEWREKDDL